MTNHVLLDNVAHKQLTVKHAYSAEYGHDVGAIIVFSTELSNIQREYPIMIHKDTSSGNYQAVAMLGLSPDENLFLQDQGQGWSANYVPAVLAKGPFLIGYEDQSASGGSANASVLHIDLDDPRVNVDGGRAVFMPHGGNSDYLNSVTEVLNGIQHGSMLDQKMFSMFDELGLIEPLAMDIELIDGQKIRVEGHYTINQDRLAALSAEELHRLHTSGFLMGAYLIVNSLENVSRVVELKNAQIASKS